MARFNVTAPDGSIIPVDAPAGATEQDAIAFAASTWKPAAAPEAVPSEIPAPRKEPGFLTKLGRGAASLADVTIGGVLPAITQQVAYPLARMGRSPEEAQAATQRMVSAVESPIGKAFGVTGTPEYQQEAGRQVLDFIGQNFQKGAKWISEKTGLPQSDVENMLGSATIAAPAAVPPVARAIQGVAAPAIEKAVVGAKMPFEKQMQARRERLSAEDYARGPQLDAAAEAQRLGIALNPADIQPTAMPKLTAMAAGPRAPAALAAVNKNQVRNVALNDMNLPSTTQLNGPKAFQEARISVAGPYEEVKKLPIQQADDAMIQRLEGIRADLDIIGAKEYAPAISKIVDDAISKTQTGLTGAEIIKNISVLRERARKTYNNKAASTEALDIADTNLKVATELESMIDSSIFNPKLLQEYRDARQKMARTYAYEGATDFNTGMVDVGKLARITSKDSALTGDIASLGKIAGNFPEVFSTKPTPGFLSAPRLSRSGAGGAAGALIGSQFGLTGSILGGALGGAAAETASALAARRMVSPSYQAGLQMQDMRIPVNQLAASMQPIPQNRAVVPYEAPVEVLMPGQGPYQPNFTMQPGQYGPRVTTPGFEAGPPQLPAPGAQGSINALRAEDVRRAQMSRTLGQQAEAQQAAAEAATRQTTGRGVQYDLDPITGRLVPTSAGVKGATPEVFMADTGQALNAAAEKVAAGKLFDMSAAEKVAWNKTKVDLAAAAPELKGLSDKAVAAKMMDRKWVNDTIDKIRQQAAAFDDISKRATTAQAMRDASMKREKMLDMLSDLEDTLRSSRPVSSGGQGKKTREFNRNQLITNTANKNALAESP